MIFKSVATALTALSLMAAPTMASAATAAHQPQPAAEQVAGDNAFFGSEGAIIGVLALLAIIGGIVAATSNSNDTPNSP